MRRIVPGIGAGPSHPRQCGSVDAGSMVIDNEKHKPQTRCRKTTPPWPLKTVIGVPESLRWTGEGGIEPLPQPRQRRCQPLHFALVVGEIGACFHDRFGLGLFGEGGVRQAAFERLRFLLRGG